MTSVPPSPGFSMPSQVDELAATVRSWSGAMSDVMTKFEALSARIGAMDGNVARRPQATP